MFIHFETNKKAHKKAKQKKTNRRLHSKLDFGGYIEYLDDLNLCSFSRLRITLHRFPEHCISPNVRDSGLLYEVRGLNSFDDKFVGKNQILHENSKITNFIVLTKKFGARENKNCR